MSEPMKTRLAFTITNDVQAMAIFPVRISGFLQPQGIDQDCIDKVLLALEEMVSNTIKYGYRDTGEHLIDIDLVVHRPVSMTCSDHPGPERELILILTDDGEMFDPLAASVPDISIPIEDRPLGGLGIHMVRSIASSMEYHRINGKNRFEIRFKTVIDQGSG